MNGLVAIKSDKSDLMPSAAEWTMMKEQATVLVKSGFLPDSVKTPEQAMAIALKGRELGLPMMQSYSQINVIKGKPAVSAELQLALIYRNVPGAKVEFERIEVDGCTILTTRPGHKPVRIKFDQADAKAADLASKDNWKKYPRAMYRSRCVSEMARTVYPDAIMGCSYTPEELGASVNEEGEVIDVTPQPRHEPPKEAPPPPEEGAVYHNTPPEKAQLVAVLVAKQVPREFWPEVATRLTGKPFSEVDAVIAAVKTGAP